MTLPKPFPNIDISEDYNPAIRLFGNRLITEQSILEYTAEFLAVVFSPKAIADNECDRALPPLDIIKSWSSASLRYKPPVKLNLKLFALIGVSRMDGNHDVHEKHYSYLIERLKDSMESNVPDDKDRILEYLGDFLSSFQGAGFNRAWCAQTFYPISPSLLTQETIWNETVARRLDTNTWNYSIENFTKYYSRTKRNYMARGGEVLYLQLCNIFRLDEATWLEWANKFEFKDEERDKKQLYNIINEGFQVFRSSYTLPLDHLADFVENIDMVTHEKTNDESYWLKAGWCPEESYPEGYLFAVELKRIITATLDPMERLELLMTGCIMQVLRTICAQSIRYGGSNEVSTTPLGYEWILSSPKASLQQRHTSQRSLQHIQGIIQKAIRTEALQKNAALKPSKSKVDVKTSLYREADSKYGFRLLLSLGKKLGIIVPYKGRGAHFVMTDKLLRYLVVALIKPGERLTYHDFLQRIYIHYGLAIEGVQLANAIAWSELPPNNALQESKSSWLAEMLSAGGFLTELSDAWSIVRNPF